MRDIHDCLLFILLVSGWNERPSGNSILPWYVIVASAAVAEPDQNSGERLKADALPQLSARPNRSTLIPSGPGKWGAQYGNAVVPAGCGYTNCIRSICRSGGSWHYAKQLRVRDLHAPVGPNYWSRERPPTATSLRRAGCPPDHGTNDFAVHDGDCAMCSRGGRLRRPFNARGHNGQHHAILHR